MSQSSSTSSSAVAEHPSVVRVRAALAAAGAGGAVVVLDDHARTAAAAAEQLGVTVAQIANSLVFAVPDEAAPGGRRPLLVLTSGAHRVDTAKLAALLGVERLDRARPHFVRGPPPHSSAPRRASRSAASPPWVPPSRSTPSSTSTSPGTSRCGRPRATRA